MRLGWLVPSWHSMVPEWTFLRGTPWLEMRRSFVAVFLSHSQFLLPFSQLYISSFLSVFLCHRCAHGCRKHPSRGSSTERTSSFLASPAVPALCPSHGCQLSSFAATLTSQPFSSLSSIISYSLFLSLCLMTQPSLCYCPGRSVSYLQPVAPLASLSCSKPKYSF